MTAAPAVDVRFVEGPGHRLCFDFVNTEWADHLGSGRINDELGSGERREHLLRRWGYEALVGVKGLRAARAGRSALRQILEAWAANRPPPRQAVRELDRILRRVEGGIAVEPARESVTMRLQPGRIDWSWLLTCAVASAVQLMDSGERRRLKVCDNPSCSFLFYDESNNATRRWCDPVVCGSLVRVRAHRARQLAPDQRGAGRYPVAKKKWPISPPATSARASAKSG